MDAARMIRAGAWALGVLMTLVVVAYLPLVIVNWNDEPLSACEERLVAKESDRPNVPDVANGHVHDWAWRRRGMTIPLRWVRSARRGWRVLSWQPVSRLPPGFQAWTRIIARQVHRTWPPSLRHASKRQRAWRRWTHTPMPSRSGWGRSNGSSIGTAGCSPSGSGGRRFHAIRARRWPAISMRSRSRSCTC